MALTRATLSKSFYRLRRLSRKLWIRSALIALLAVVAALTARPLAFLIPDPMAAGLTEGAVAEIVRIIASSMLAVTIFSLSIMVAARQAASSQVTPRTHQLLIEDTTTQTVLATFLGAFIFSLVSLIVLDTGYFSGKAAVVILFFTLLVIGLVVIAILRWIDHLSELGSVIETTRKVEHVARDALRQRVEWPCLGARALTEGMLEIPVRAMRLHAWSTGYIQHIDMASLSEAVRASHGQVFLLAAPGKFVTEGQPLLYHTGDLPEKAVRSAFTISDSRVFDQDPRFGVIVLTEIAQRALSPGINDPGTAIDVISRLQRVLLGFRDEAEAKNQIDPHYPSIWMPPVTARTLLRDSFEPIARDAADTVEVQIRLQKALAALAEGSDATMAEAARDSSARALEMALPHLPLDAHRARLEALAVGR
ncbi:DUF2254 domain-containing protein [Palleronia rufa]|uniref:DUF2254 domain-containing protein n=1 Tax=Palleronia rufa TaxID=1530186 RepID=UPI000562C2CE|nr:DUF2254 domain-containing protein [Palleronia rufa]